MLPYRVCTPRLTLRCLEPGDARTLSDVTAANEAHLSPWMAWAHDLPRPLERTTEHLEKLSAEFSRGHDFSFGVWDRSDGDLVGGLGIHPRCGPGGFEIGYWIVGDKTRRGYASEAAGAATRVAIEILGAERVEIHVQPGNVASSKVPERLGFRRVALERNRLQWRDGTWRDQVVWALRDSELADSPAAEVHCEVFDTRHEQAAEALS